MDDNEVIGKKISAEDDEEASMKMVISRKVRRANQTKSTTANSDADELYHNNPPDVAPTNNESDDDDDDKDSQDGNEVSANPVAVSPDVAVADQQQQEQNEYAAIIPEAFLVSDEEREDQQPVIISGYAEALVPWWKQTRTKILLGTFVVCVAVLSVTLGVILSSNDDTTTAKEVVKIQTVIASSPPSSSFIPSAAPSHIPTTGPSISHAPTPFPTTLFDKLESQQKVASDGSSMVMVTQDEGYLIIVFYTLTNDGMQRVGAFSTTVYGDYFTVSINEVTNTTILDFPNDCFGEGAQLIYERVDNYWYAMEDSRCGPPLAEQASGIVSSSDGKLVISPWLVATASFVLLFVNKQGMHY